MRLHLLLVVCLFGISTLSFSQQHLFVGGQMDYGYLFRKTSGSPELLGANGLGSSLNFGISTSYRIFDALTVEVGARSNRYSLPLRDKDFESRVDGFEANIRSLSWHNSFYGALKGSYEFDRLTYAFFRAAGEYHMINSDSRSASTTYVKGFETLSVNATYGNTGLVISPEIGIETFDDNGNLWTIGLRYSHNIGDNFLTGTYDHLSPDSTLSSNDFTFAGNTLALTLQYNFRLMYKDKRERPPKKVKVEPLETLGEAVDIIEPVITDVEDADVNEDDRIAEDREYEVTHHIRVKSEKVTVTVWDHQIEDGDIISLILNDNFVLQNYKLKNKKYTFEVTLREGNNDFILHALNLGKYKPNTAAITINDGIKDHTVVLESTLDQSGAMEIKYVKEKEKKEK